MGIHMVDTSRIMALYQPAPNSELGTAVNELELLRSQVLENEETAVQLETIIDNLRIELANCKKREFEKRSLLEGKLRTARLRLMVLDRALGRLKMRERILNQKCLQETRLIRNMR